MEKQPPFFSRIKPGVLLLVFSAAAYIPLLFLPFVFDDVMSVRNNPLLRDLSNAAYLFHPAYTHVFRNEGFEPFTFLYLMLAGKLVAWQAWGFHALSLLAHAACAWTVYKLAQLLLEKEKPALLAGLIFALHPAQAETLVAALFSGTVFSALFFLAALYRFMERDGRDGAPGKLLTGLLFGVSLLFKERAFSGLLLFCLLPFLRSLPNGESPLTPASPGGGLKELRRRLPELLSLAFFWTAALFSRLSAGRGSGLGFKDLDPAFLLAKLAAYAKILLLPFWLSPVYQKTSALPGPAGLAALLLAGGIIFLALKYSGRGRRGYNPAALGASAFLLLLLPYLNLLPVNDLAEYLNSVFVSNRYLYLPLAGAAVVFAAFADKAEELLRSRTGGPVFLKASGAALLALCLALSAQQQLIWRSDERVWLRAVKINPASPWANYMLGSYYLQQGLPDEALPRLDLALSLNPPRGVLSNALGALAAARLLKGETKEAEQAALKALGAWEFNYDAWNIYGAALAGLGKRKEAAAAFEKAAEAEITGDTPLVNLGRLYLELGDPAKAAAAFERALKRENSVDTLDLLCGAYAASGRLKEASGACLASLGLKPDRPPALLRLARIYLALGMGEPAELCLAEAARLDPANPEPQALLKKLRGKK
ncbi:MAG: tetratricopeptide repeat protein [Elusimicrobiales bacterium]|nr:tetratricopeptide repeat protein [Elusimicrobiales bacterium]